MSHLRSRHVKPRGYESTVQQAGEFFGKKERVIRGACGGCWIRETDCRISEVWVSGSFVFAEHVGCGGLCVGREAWEEHSVGTEAASETVD